MAGELAVFARLNTPPCQDPAACKQPVNIEGGGG